MVFKYGPWFAAIVLFAYNHVSSSLPRLGVVSRGSTTGPGFVIHGSKRKGKNYLEQKQRTETKKVLMEFEY